MPAPDRASGVQKRLERFQAMHAYQSSRPRWLRTERLRLGGYFKHSRL
jgi:hypothetical protein